ncbi:hypothetical protein J2Y38_004038 [Flavobacterium sp. 2755]|nr:hypothetical protein [Flavobacterium sp. 2755]
MRIAFLVKILSGTSNDVLKMINSICSKNKYHLNLRPFSNTILYMYDKVYVFGFEI